MSLRQFSATLGCTALLPFALLPGLAAAGGTESFVATMVRTIFAQPDADTVREQHRRIVIQLE